MWDFDWTSGYDDYFSLAPSMDFSSFQTPSMDWSNFDWGSTGQAAAPEFGNLFSGAQNYANFQAPATDWSQIGTSLGGGEGLVGWNPSGSATQAPVGSVGSLGSGGSGLDKWWGNVQQGFTDPRNLAKLVTGAGASLINQAFAPKTKLPAGVQGYYDSATRASQAQENFANQQAANYNAYRVPLQQQITNTASFLGTPEDIEQYTNKKLADQQARAQGARLQTMRNLSSQGYSPGSARALNEQRKLQHEATLGLTNARNQGMTERQDWALGQQANAAKLWEAPNYNPATYAALGSNLMGTTAVANQMNRTNVGDIARGIGDILTYDPAEAGRNQRATTPQAPTSGRYAGQNYGLDDSWWNYP